MSTALAIYSALAGITGLVGAAWILLCLRRSKKKQIHHMFIQQDNWSE
jgi:hypothetical protein